MINNPMQQIERTQDAYAGNPEGLQKRANMSKELIDLLAMQALQSDLAAQKRNMAMQQQGNPQTVKDQLEEGLMGEYRQKAAEDLGVGPSEGDVVERAGIAGQQMAQNAQMPQGPQGGGGVASQAGPVKLAGGGIVSFDAGGKVSEEQIRDYLKTYRLPDNSYNRDLAIEDITIQQNQAPTVQGTTRNPRGRQTAPTVVPTVVPTAGPSAGPSTGPSAGGIPTMLDPEYLPDLGPKPKPELKPETIESPSVNQGIAEPSLKEREAAIMRDMVELSNVEAYKPNAAVTAAMEKQLQRDPAKEAEAAAARVAEFGKLDEGIGALTDRRQRAKDLYKERNDPRKIKQGRFFALLGGLGDGGTRGANKAARAYEQKQTDLRDKHEANLNAIDDASILLQRTVGAKQAEEYNVAAKAADTAITNAMGTLVDLDAVGNTDRLNRIELKMKSQQGLAEYVRSLSQQEQQDITNMLARERITQDNSQIQMGYATRTVQALVGQIADITQDVQEQYVMQLNAAKNDPVKLATLETEIDGVIADKTALATGLLEDARNTMERITKVAQDQNKRMTGSSFGSAADAEVNKYKG